MTTENVPQKWEKTVITQLSSDGFKNQLAMALPRTVPADYFLRTVITLIRTTPALKDCSFDSLAAFVMNGAQLNLSVQPALGQIYAVPFKDKTGQKQAQTIIGYRGLITLGRRTGQVSTIQADVVRERDLFEFQKGTEPKLKHIPRLDDGGKVIAAYAVVTFKDGACDFEIMGLAEINRIKNRSKAKDSGPWVTDEDEMRKKTVLRRLLKRVPMAVEDVQMAKAVELDNQDFIPDAEFSEADEAPKKTASQKLKEARAAEAEPTPPAEKVDPKAGWFYCEAAKRELSPDAVDAELCNKCPRPDAPECEHFTS